MMFKRVVRGVQCLVPSPHSKKRFLTYLHVLPASAWLPSRYSSFLPQSETYRYGVRLTGHAEGVNVNGRLSLYVSSTEHSRPGCTPPLTQCQLGSAPAPPMTLKDKRSR